MPKITVTTTIKTIFEVPEGLTIEQIRHQALSDLAEDEEASDSVMSLHSLALNRVYLGDAEALAASVEQSIIEGTS